MYQLKELLTGTLLALIVGHVICEPAPEPLPDGIHGHGVSVSSNSFNKNGGSSGGYDLPPPPPGDASPPTDGPGPVGGGGPLPGGYPGVGYNFGVNAGAGGGIGPFLSGLGGNFGIGGGVGGVPFGGPVGGPVGGGPVGGGFLGPSYVPATWLGSALGAKGDILFPIVIVIFFIVGVWTVINILLALVVPLIGAKLGFANSITNAVTRHRRSPDDDDSSSVDDLTQSVTDALDTEY